MPSFPLIPPSSPSASDLKLTPNNIVGENESPFTYSQQIFEYPGDRWEAELALPAMSRAQAEPWLAFLSALRGKAGTFLLGDPNGVPQGSAARSNVNLLRWSEAFDNAVWFKNSNVNGTITVTADATADPNGLVDADQIAFPSTVGLGNLAMNGFATPPNGTTSRPFTFSVWMRAASPCSISIDIEDTPFTGGNSAVCSVTTSWQRFSVTWNTGPSINAGLVVNIFLLGGTAATTIFAWGAQLEQASSASAYIGTSFGNSLLPQIAMNGTTQGPKIILLKGLAPNSVAFKAGDYIECGYGLAATRITTSGGTNTVKFDYQAVNPSVAGVRYATSVRVRNLGAKTVVVADDLGMNVSVVQGAEVAVSGSNLGNASPYLLAFTVVSNVADALDFVAWSPRAQKFGIDENLVPVGNQNFTGWTNFSGSAVSLVQGYNRRLYKVLSDSSSDASGNCGVEIFPRWRSGDAVADGDPVNVFSPKGMFRLQDNPRTWQIGSDLLTQGVTLKCKEAL